MWWWIIWKHTKCTKKPLTGTVKMKNLTKSAECQHYRRNSDVGYLWNLSRCKLQVWHEQTEGRGGGGYWGVSCYATGQMGLLTHKVMSERGVQFPQAAMLSEPFKMVVVCGREDKRGDGGVTKVRGGTWESSRVRASHLQPYSHASYLLHTSYTSDW